MKKPRKMKLIEEIIVMLKEEGKPITHEEVSKWCMTQTYQGTHYAGRYGSLKQGDFSLYFREYYPLK